MLRNVIVSVLIQPEIPIINESRLDIGLLRAAHQALLRQQSGKTDILLFVIFSNSAEEAVTKSIEQYGFPCVQIIYQEINADDLENNYDDVKNLIGTLLSAWIDTNHPAAITYFPNDVYGTLDIWWAGIEADKDNCEWLFLDKYAETLPASHKKKASTWLEILSEIIETKEPCWSNDNQFLLYAATLCEWLHGFEAASGDGFNGFEADVVYDALTMDDFYFGFLLGQCAPNEEYYALLENNDINNIEDLKSYTLLQATSNERSTLRNMLSGYFGNDGNLFWALHSAIWPNYQEPSSDLCCSVLYPICHEDLTEIWDSWQFVTNGWTDSADE